MTKVPELITSRLTFTVVTSIFGRLLAERSDLKRCHTASKCCLQDSTAIAG
jgi:hypothetical protein